jgi:SAM-dependent methyltransferase
MTTRGILYLAFGKEYDNLAAHTIAQSWKFIPASVPVTVLSNVPVASLKWECLPNVNFIKLNILDNENRAVRTRLINYTPYDETLYIDCDSVITKPGIENIFDLFGDNDAIFQQFGAVWTKEKRYYQIYRDAVKLFECSLPFTIYAGGFFAFKKTAACERFFDFWHAFWKRHNVGRDMPALCCAIQKSGIKHATITKEKHKFFSFGMNSDAIILHMVHSTDLNTYFGTPQHKHNKDFDKGNSWFWNMVYFDEIAAEIMNDPFVKTKFNPVVRYAEKRKYIDKFLPEMKTGGLDILDIACGPGEFLELAQELDCRTTGIESYSKMLDRSIDHIYSRYSRMKVSEKRLNVLDADFNDVLANGYPDLEGKKFDIINCQHAINFIAGMVFDWKFAPGADYKNNGEWNLDDNPTSLETGRGLDFFEFFMRYFTWCKTHLHNNGIVMIAALNAMNAKEYSVKLKTIAKNVGFECLIDAKSINHKFRLSNG